MKPVVITVDGPGGVGKSTIARLLAERLGFTCLDSGACYRTMTLAAMRSGIDLQNERCVRRFARDVSFRVVQDKKGVRAFLGDEEVTNLIREPELTSNIRYLAGIGAVRERVKQMLRAAAENQHVLAEGRDMGTVVFQDADVKFYLDADAEIRAVRRRDELKRKGIDTDLKRLHAAMQERDRLDAERELAPLRKADDAIVIDTSTLTIAQVLETMERLVQQCAPRMPDA